MKTCIIKIHFTAHQLSSVLVYFNRLSVMIHSCFCFLLTSGFIILSEILPYSLNLSVVHYCFQSVTMQVHSLVFNFLLFWASFLCAFCFILLFQCQTYFPFDMWILLCLSSVFSVLSVLISVLPSVPLLCTLPQLFIIPLITLTWFSCY